MSSMARSLRVFAVDQFRHANKENTSDRMNKPINLNPVSNTESLASSINSILSVEIVKGSRKLFTFVRS